MSVIFHNVLSMLVPNTVGICLDWDILSPKQHSSITNHHHRQDMCGRRTARKAAMTWTVLGAASEEFEIPDTNKV